MAGITRWKDLQNIFVTEDQINLLAGLEVSAIQLNQLLGFVGTGEQLNLAINSVSTLNNHISKDLSQSHQLLPNSIDGGVLAGTSVSKDKLSFNALTDADKVEMNAALLEISNKLTEATNQINNLYGIVIPGQASDLAQSIAQVVAHLQKTTDAHDATAISFGNEYSLIETASASSNAIKVSLSDIRFFSINDQLELKDVFNGPEIVTAQYVNYNTGYISITPNLAREYKPASSAIVKNISQADVQAGLERSLRNTTDNFTGRLSITQSSTDDAIVINKTNSGYALKGNDLSFKSLQDNVVELGKSDSTSMFEIRNSSRRRSFQVLDDGNTWLNNITLEDRLSGFTGLLTKQSLIKDVTWTLPNRGGFVGIGDLTFTELLKVSLSGSKSIYIAPGFAVDYTGQIVSAWIGMEESCKFPGGTVDVEARMRVENQLITLENKYQVIVPYISDGDILAFFYGPQEATKEDAITNYKNYIPSAYMKLAKLIVQGDGNGNLKANSIEILEDQRPFLTMGMSAAFYEEKIYYATGLSAGVIITLPPNTRGGGSFITYKTGKAQLEVFLDGIYQTVDSDYAEHQGEPIAQIRLLKDVPKKSTLKFRITFKAAAVAGGIQVDTLQSVYQAGPMIGLSAIYGPIKLTGFDITTLLDITGDVLLDGYLRLVKAINFTATTMYEGLAEEPAVWINNNHELMLHQYIAGEPIDINISKEITLAQKASSVDVYNNTGLVIPAGRGLTIHSGMVNSVVLCNTSNKLNTSRLDGISAEAILPNSWGKMITSGELVNAGINVPHGTVVVVNPRQPGMLVAVDTFTWLPDDVYQEAGKMNGSSLIVDIDRTDKRQLNIIDRVLSGESFEANKTYVVRYGLYGETRGAVYKADTKLANANNKFWAIGFVQPKTAITAGQRMDIYKSVSLTANDEAFDDIDIGLPFYLSTGGLFKSWRNIKGTYELGEAIVKLGMTKDRRELIIDSIQVMGTAKGPME